MAPFDATNGTLARLFEVERIAPNFEGIHWSISLIICPLCLPPAVSFAFDLEQYLNVQLTFAIFVKSGRGYHVCVKSYQDNRDFCGALELLENSLVLR